MNIVRLFIGFLILLSVSSVGISQKTVADLETKNVPTESVVLEASSERDFSFEEIEIGKLPLVPPKQKQNSSYQFPDKKTRFNRYVKSAVGPAALGGAAIGATFQQIGETPPEWEQNSKGFARRFASNVAENVIQETTQYGLSEAFKQDTKYYECDCSGIGKRTVHALKSGFTARNRNGDTVFSPGKVASPFVANVIAVKTWYPERYTVKDGLRQGGYSLLFGAGFNLVREFIF